MADEELIQDLQTQIERGQVVERSRYAESLSDEREQ